MPTAMTTPIDKPMVKIARKRMINDGGGNIMVLGEKIVIIHEIKIIVESKEPPTALARNAVK